MQDGKHLSGEFRERFEDSVSIIVEVTDENRTDLRAGSLESGAQVKKAFRFDEVESAEIPLPPGWMYPHALSTVPEQKKLELLLVSGRTVRGRFRGVTATSVQLGDEKLEAYPLDDIAAARRLGRTTKQKWILAGVIAGGIGAIGAVMANSCWEYGC